MRHLKAILSLASWLLLWVALPVGAQSITDFVNLNRTPTPVYCGWECGLRIERDTIWMSGGDFQNTNSQFMLWNKVGKGIKNREFTGLVLTESEQDSGEAVSLYLKTEKRGSAPAWAGTFELRDKWNKSGSSVGIEVDMFTAGPATDPEYGVGSNGGRVRVGVDIVGGDESFKDGGAKTDAQGTYGFNVYATATTPWFRWLYGGRIGDYKRTGLQLIGRAGDLPERGIDIIGDHVVGIDFSHGTFQSVIRVKQGDAYTYDQWDDWRILRSGEELVVQQRVLQGDKWRHVTVMAITRQGEVKARKFTVIR